MSLTWMTVVNFALLTTASFVNFSTTDTLNLCVSYKLSGDAQIGNNLLNDVILHFAKGSLPTPLLPISEYCTC